MHRLNLAALTLAVLFAATACNDEEPKVPQVSGDNASASIVDDSESPAPEQDGPTAEELDKFFAQIASLEPDKMKRAMRLTAEGSVARAWLTMYHARSLASQQSGDPWDPATSSRTDDGYKVCFEKADCARYTVKARGDLVADVTIDGKPLKKRLILGSAKKIPVGDLVTVRLIGSQSLVSSGDLVIALEATAKASVTLGWSSDGYVGPDGVQSATSGTTGPSPLRAGATSIFVYVVPDAKIGGDLYITAVEDGGAQRDATATIPTG